MGIPKFKVGDKVQIKDFPPTQNCLKVEAIHIYEDKIVYTVIPYPTPVVIKPMEIAEDRLELIGDYTIVVKSGEYGFYGAKSNDSIYCSHFRTKEKAEEAILDLMTTQATELMARHKDLKDIESIDVSFKLKYIAYETNKGSYLIQYEVKKAD